MIIRFATIGSGFIVDSFLKGAAMDPRFQHVAVYSRTQERGQEFAVKHGVSQVFTSLEELAQCPDIDAVYIASPNHCHASQAILMMSHGKHVLCEKPMAPTVEEARAMVETARRNGVALMEAMKTTLLPNFLAVKENLPRIGTVRRYHASFCQYSSRFSAFLSGGPVANVFRAQAGAGALLDLGVYGLAPMVHLFGEPLSARIFPTMLSPGGGFDPATAVDIQGSLVADYPGMQACITYSKAADGAQGLEILGENGMIVVEKTSTMLSPRLKMRAGVGDHDLRGGDASWEDLSRPTLDNMYYEVREFLNLIEEGRIESSVNNFARTLAVIGLAAGESSSK